MTNHRDPDEFNIIDYLNLEKESTLNQIDPVLRTLLEMEGKMKQREIVLPISLYVSEYKGKEDIYWNGHIVKGTESQTLLNMEKEVKKTERMNELYKSMLPDIPLDIVVADLRSRGIVSDTVYCHACGQETHLSSDFIVVDIGAKPSS